jgi:preprotein translocase subunit SecE
MNANVENQEQGNAFDKVKWVLIVVILGAAIVANNQFGEMSVLLRAGGFVVAVAIALLLASQTEKGRTFLAFAKESKIEVRKVVWPNRQEATHTTVIIVIATFAMALLMWFIDMVLRWGIGLLTGLEF